MMTFDGTAASDDTSNTASDNKNIRKIIEILLNSGPQTPTQLAEKLGVHQVTISRYLKTLRDNGWVEFMRDGVEKFYTVKRKEWKKYVEENILFSIDSFSKVVKELDHPIEVKKRSKNLKITIDAEHEDFEDIKKRLGDPVITKIFKILIKPMNVNDICEQGRLYSNTVYLKICTLEKLTLLAKKSNLSNLTSGKNFEKTFEKINIIILNYGELIEIIPKPEYYSKMYIRFKKE